MASPVKQKREVSAISAMDSSQLDYSIRTLCMHRYQRQVGGSVEEFNAYFEALLADAKAVCVFYYFVYITN